MWSRKLFEIKTIQIELQCLLLSFSFWCIKLTQPLSVSLRLQWSVRYQDARVGMRAGPVGLQSTLRASFFSCPASRCPHAGEEAIPAGICGGL